MAAMHDDGTRRGRQAGRDERRERRNRLVEEHVGLARHLARRLSAGRDDDVDQVAQLALVQAAERFDPARGVAFAAFAAPTIEGAIKRWFESTSWPVGVPRRLKLLALELESARTRLEQRFARSPTVAELAAEVGADRDDVLEALAARATRSVADVDAISGDGSTARGSGHADEEVERVNDELLVETLLARFEGEDRRIIELRFVEGLSQDAIADAVGVSQMQVSRVLRRCVDRLRQLAR
jgi:RNA polymerase sigma-B factor